MRHKLADIDLENKTATCSNCGKVDIKKTPAMKNPRCRVAVRENYAAYKFRSRYGLEYDRSIHKGVVDTCELCHNKRRLVYDHDHASGAFRGWICNNCNLLLGLAKDNPATLVRCSDYLKRV